MVDGCIFCKIVQNTAPTTKVYEDDEVIAFFDIYPVARYHTLVIPKLHYSSLFDIPSELLGKVIEVTQKIAIIYRDSLDIENLHLVNSCGKYAQQDVFHFHIHIIPRFPNDGNNITWKKHPEYQTEFSELLRKLPRIK